MTAEAGVTIANLQQHARAVGLDYGVDLGSRDSATIGGTVATNAGGIRVVCRGDTRSQVLGVEAVLADGSVTSHLGGLPKDSAGYDVSNLLVGSEGTLGIVTKVRVRLCDPLPESRVTLLIGVASMDDALELMDGNRGAGTAGGRVHDTELHGVGSQFRATAGPFGSSMALLPAVGDC